MTKKDRIKWLRKGHERLKRMVSRLSADRMVKEKVLDDWTVKDIISHLSAWNWEELRVIDDLLANRKPVWWGLDESEFNRRAIRERKDWSIDAVLKEWEESFETFLARVSELSEEEWVHEAAEKGEDGLSVSVDAMMSYEYKGEDHEGGHAKQIEEFMRKSKSRGAPVAREGNQGIMGK